MAKVEQVDRREFLRAAAIVAGAGIAASGCATGGTKREAATGVARGPAGENMSTFAAPKLDVVRVGIVGVGKRGPAHVRNLLKLEGVEIRAICDVVPEHAENGAAMVTKAKRAKPGLYTRGPEDYRRMNDRDDLDLIVNATPWDWHVPMSLDAMRKGKHAFTEVPFAQTIDQCWELVETSEKTRRHCVMMENCCYGEMELLCLNLCRQGMFGELLHGEGAYLHYLAAAKLGGKNETNGRWRLQPSKVKNGNTYPTHGLGPVAQYMGVNRGDRFDYLVSMSSPSRGIQVKAEELFGKDDPRAKTQYTLGDMNTSIIKTARGRTIMVQHDTSNPRPYSRINTIQGTKGIFCGYPDRVSFNSDEWADLEKVSKEHMHPLWRRLGPKAVGAGHGGMDYVMMARLIECLRAGSPLDMDVYDAAALSAVTELSCRSVANRSGPVDFPDFTRGRWKENKELGVVS